MANVTETLLILIVAYFLFSGKVLCSVTGRRTTLTPAQQAAQERQQQIAAGYKAPTTAQAALSTAGTVASLLSKLLSPSGAAKQTAKPQTPVSGAGGGSGGGLSAPSLQQQAPTSGYRPPSRACCGASRGGASNACLNRFENANP